MNGWIYPPADALRRSGWAGPAEGGASAVTGYLWNIAVCGFAYGLAMGTFRLVNGQPQWLLQMVYSGIKVPLLLSVAFLVCLPNYFVLNTLFGLRKDFAASLRALVATQAGFAIALASMAPVTLLWYASSSHYAGALVFNGLMFAASGVVSQVVLRDYYRPLAATDPRHLRMLPCWGLLYVIVSIQLAWLLRPFVGSPQGEVQFIRPEAWDNAYVFVTRLVWRTLGG